MSDKIIPSAFSRFKKSYSSYIAVGLFCGLLFVLASTIYIIDPAFFVLLIPIFILPSFFASTISCYYLEANQPITLRAFFHYYAGFFRPQFRGSFRGISSFLKAFGLYILFFIFAYIFFYMLYRQRYGEQFIQEISEMMSSYSESGSNYVVNVLSQQEGLLYRFITYTSGAAFPFGITAFIYFVSYSSLSIYYRANISSASNALLRLAIGNTYANNRRKMRIDWFKLNWPLLVLAFLGGVIGEIIAKYALGNLELISPFALIGACLFITFFLPFYFANMETIFHRYEEGFKQGNKEAVTAILERIQSSIDLSEEEKKELENSFQQKEVDDKEEEQ